MKGRRFVCCLMLTLLADIRPGMASAQTTDIPAPLVSIASWWAPYLMHETWLSASPVGSVDHMMRVDHYYGYTYGPDIPDWSTWPGSDHTASMYYSAVESGYTSDQGYYYLGYYWYHPHDRGWDGKVVFWGVGDQGHEHDMEGAMFLVKKSPYLPFGTLVAAVTQAHGELVPWVNNQQSEVSTDATGTTAQGPVAFWPDTRYGTQRAVVAIRGRNHGSHFPAVQLSNVCYGGADGGFGILPSDGSSFAACVHDGFDWILYYPTDPSGQPAAQVIPMDTVRGAYRYQLLELSKSPIWTDKQTQNDLFSGTPISMGNGLWGYPSFYSFADPDQANPPYAWEGGGGCHDLRGDYQCWYSFGEDGTTSWEDPKHWPVSPIYGQFLIDPARDFTMRFSNLPAAPPYRYNPYSASPPDYYGNQPFSGNLSGPFNSDGSTPSTFVAQPRWGVPPYTYEWSGALSGTEQSITGVIYSEDDLFLDMWDAAGQHVALSQHIAVNSCPNNQISC